MENHLKQDKFRIVEFSFVEEVMMYEDTINILLLDIGWDSLDKFHWKEEIETKKNIDIIIFVSNCIEAVFDTYGRKTRGFLLKPIKEKGLVAVIKKCLFELTSSYHVLLKSGEEFDSNQLFFITSTRNNTYIHLQDEEICTRKTLKEWEKELKQHHFVRVHKSYLVNMEKIKQMKGCIELENGKKIPIGRVYKEEARNLYMQFLKSR